MNTSCVDLKAQFADRYRLARDECADKGDVWGWEIRGRRGTVYPHGGPLLAVEVDRSPAARREMEARGYPVHQCGDTERTYLVPAADLDGLADVLRLPRRRRLTAEGRARLAEASKATRFRPRC